jgi:hypothetical protein
MSTHKKLNKEKVNKKTRKLVGLTSFESDFEKDFIIKNSDFLSTNFHLDKKIIHDLKTAISPSKIKPQDDFYSYINERWLKSFNPEYKDNFIRI